MLFVNPLLLAGTGLVALPIVLHLVMRQRPKRMEFPALRFIQRRHDTNRRQLRLRHLLLLALRTMLIALVAFALARPSLKSAGAVLGGQKEPVAAALVFDTSARMDYRHENQTRLEAAQEMGRWLLAQLPPESQVAVLDSRLGPGAFQVDAGAARDRMQRLETAANAQPLPGALEEALRLVETSPLARKEVYVFTDLAQVAWPSSASARLQTRMAAVPHIGVYLIDVGVEKPTNFSLGDLHLARQVLPNRSALKLNVEITATGAGGARTVEFYLLEPDPEKKGMGERRPIRSDARHVTLEPGQTQQLEFSAQGLALGSHQGYLQILGQDGLPADDRRFFSVEVTRPWQVLIVAPKPVEQYAFYLPEALAPKGQRLLGQERFECVVISQEELADYDLGRVQVVHLLDPEPMEPAVWQKLADFVAGGKGLAVFLGRNAEPVDAFRQGPVQELLAGAPLRQAGNQEVYLAPRDFEHPVLAEFRGLANVPWFHHTVRRYWQLSEAAAGVHVIVPYSNEDAAILERPLGSGRAITVTTPISDDINARASWNLLPVGWPFFILVNTMTEYLAGSTGQKLNYAAGETVVFALDAQQPYKSFALTGPGELQVRLIPDPKQHALVFGGTDQPGNYRVQAGGTDDGVDRGFSVNLAAMQTRLERLSRDELAAYFGPVPFRFARSEEEIEINVNTARVGRELFPMLIVAVALILGLEQVVANRFYRGA